MPAWPAGVRGVFTTRAGGTSLPPYAIQASVPGKSVLVQVAEDRLFLN